MGGSNFQLKFLCGTLCQNSPILVLVLSGILCIVRVCYTLLNVVNRNDLSIIPSQ